MFQEIVFILGIQWKQDEENVTFDVVKYVFSLSKNLTWILDGNRKENTISALIHVVYHFSNSYFGFWFDLADEMMVGKYDMVVFGIANCHCVW